MNRGYLFLALLAPLTACALIAGIEQPVARATDAGADQDSLDSSADEGREGGLTFCRSAMPPHAFCDDWDESYPVNFQWSQSKGLAPNSEAGSIVVDLDASAPSPPGASRFALQGVASNAEGQLNLSTLVGAQATRSVHASFKVRIDAPAAASRLTTVAQIDLASSGVTPVYTFALRTSPDADGVQQASYSDAGNPYPYTPLYSVITQGQWTLVDLVLDLNASNWTVSFNDASAIPAQAMNASVVGPVNVVFQIGIVGVAGPDPAVSYHFDDVFLDVE